MRFLRSHLARIVGVWLVCQFAVLAAAPLSHAGSFGSSEQALLCTCGSGGPDQDCPMHGSHHHPTTKQDPHDCAMRSADPVSDVMLTSLIGGLGLIPPSQIAVAATVTSEAVVSVPALVLVQPVSPDSPPPKPTFRVVDLS
jgi:hypothetical protein